MANALARGVAPSRVPASPTAMFRAMERSGRGREYLADAGVNANTRTQLNWLTGESTPNAANQRAIRNAYDRWAGANARKRTNSTRPGSTPIEIYPYGDKNDTYGQTPRTIHITDQDLGRAIELTARGDIGALDSMWIDLVESQLQDSPVGKKYANVSHVWIG